ncbi:hypothetical protein PIB30_061578 [Stylosanthes scabra]|uniref:Uncharacterized protein n=1 Tax=Stylosanthes scabra TaxID=79078 RepID=A0ABU6YMS5_9FABA|nr:hypothetical protein [Stylosanthes scabra]
MEKYRPIIYIVDDMLHIKSLFPAYFDFPTLFRGNHVPYGCSPTTFQPQDFQMEKYRPIMYIVDMLHIKNLLAVYLDFPTLRGNHVPYGCGFPNHTPTGRFSNGKISTDYIVDVLRVKSLLPAYLDYGINDGDLLTGVSFGAGGSGLDSNTAESAEDMNMDVQLQHFQECLERIRQTLSSWSSEDCGGRSSSDWVPSSTSYN